MKRHWAALLTLLFAASANAGHPAPLVDVTITDLDTGRTLPLHEYRGRSYVPGEPGNRYAVALRNRTGERVLAVLSVDGVNVVTGQTASPGQGGYVLGPYERAEIRGWRKNLSEVAEFYFTELPDSYAARTGRPDDVGVIGVAVFRERVYIPPPSPPIAAEPRRERDGYGAGRRAQPPAAASAPSPSTESSAKSADSMAAQELGTGHGERRYDPVATTEFVRASSRPEQVVAIWYDSHEALVDRGVIRAYRWRRPGREPDPFPVGFVPDPY